MVSAGVPLLRAINTLAGQTENKTFKETLSAVSKDVQAGISLGDSFARHPTAFSDIYVNMVRAGESGGILDDILKRLAIQQEKTTRSRKKSKCHDLPDGAGCHHCRRIFWAHVFVIPR